MAVAFNDFHIFFDTVNIPALLDQSMLARYPARDLSLALQMHLAPRVLQLSGYTSDPVNIYNSLLAGCRHSVAMTRSLLLDSLQHIYNTCPRAPPMVHVYDTSMISYGDSWTPMP